ncbi:hypothetical protein POTOM_004023 [Populus tomentosa]|uniref:Uncharacterized protein n=1 Tax=Populus tomentosa TaxID=118781 RepID=A0A8X8DDD8_POPTO|nr:hypothetical protein POTOM_004023 [Populus tomentosa]
MSDWGPVFMAVVLFILLTPGLLFQVPGRHRCVEFGNFQTSGASIMAHTLLYFALICVFLLAVKVHLYLVEYTMYRTPRSPQTTSKLISEIAKQSRNLGKVLAGKVARRQHLLYCQHFNKVSCCRKVSLAPQHVSISNNPSDKKKSNEDSCKQATCSSLLLIILERHDKRTRSYKILRPEE